MAIVMIIGASGFIGSHLAERFVALGHDVHCVVRPSSDPWRLERVRGKIVLHTLDLLDRPSVAECMAGVRPEIIFHLAAETRRPAEFGLADALESLQDVQALLSVLAATSAIATIRSFVRAASLSEYGTSPTASHEAAQETPENAYAAAMLAGTRYGTMLQPRLPFPLVSARLALVYGPRQSLTFLIPRMIESCLKMEKIVVSRPDDRRDLLYVGDAVDALSILGLRPPANTPIVNVGTGVAPTMRTVARLVVEATGVDPSLVSFANSTSESQVLLSSPALARRLLGWQAETGLSAGIAQTVGSFPGRARQQDERLLGSVY